jgi:hypothetical protein
MDSFAVCAKITLQYSNNNYLNKNYFRENNAIHESRVEHGVPSQTTFPFIFQSFHTPFKYKSTLIIKGGNPLWE